jgi:hypothetical protein
MSHTCSIRESMPMLLHIAVEYDVHDMGMERHCPVVSVSADTQAPAYPARAGR